MRLVLGVGGGIAAYKAAELVRALQNKNHEVQVVMTRSAQEFVQPLTFAALSGKKVITGLFSQASEADTFSSSVEHIAVARDNRLLVVAPATADLLAKFAHGLADDFLSTLYLAFTGPVVLAPAMNTEMWDHAATQENVAVLRARGHIFVDPEEGWLACGAIGAGRLAEPHRIAETVDRASRTKRDLEGERVLITAGPTQEPLDPVRFVSNRSSGKMGYAIADAAAARGAHVVLVSGPVSLPPPLGVEVVRVRTAQEMRSAVMERLSPSSIIIKAAAVADYHLAKVPQHKLKKTAARLSVELDPTPDILAEVGQKKGDRLLIGFAAETDHLVEEARRKMQTKNCDMVVANFVGHEGTGFESDLNEVTMVTRGGETIHAGPAEKSDIAELILDQVLKLRLILHAVAEPA
ncbi:MAG: bifunctional phosphopantothenoylcysteine decarboxylase/phosphopantothenate--cysteine ligase CoaBC [Bryobacteraceae bacterium]